MVLLHEFFVHSCHEGGDALLLYLMRHGEAIPETDDPRRPLSGAGRAEVEKMASFVCGNLYFLPGNILTSPKLRAVQTAGIMGSALRNPLKPQETDGLLPGDGPSTWAERMQAYDRDLMLVGHLPHLSRLASLLLCWDPGRNLVHFPPAAILCLSYQGGWAVRWALAPDLLKG